MVSQVPIPTSLRLGEIFAVLLGLGLSTITIGARVYVKSRVLKKFLSEDCKSLGNEHAKNNGADIKQISQSLPMYVGTQNNFIKR